METIASSGNMSDLVSDVNSNFSEASIKDRAFKVTSESLTGGTMQPDGANGNFFDAYLNTEHNVVNNIANMREGEAYMIQVRQDAGGKNHVHWGTRTANTGLTISTYPGVGNSVLISVDAGTFDWSSLSVATGLKTKLTISGLNENPMNVGGLEIDSFDESAGEIYVTNPFSSSLSGEAGTTGVSITCVNSNYFFATEKDNWIDTKPFGITMFRCWSAGEGMVSIEKIGTHTNDVRHKASARTQYEIVDDFIAGNDDGQLQWSEKTQTGKSVINQSSADVDGSHFGVVYHRINVGQTNTRTAMILVNDGFVLNDSKSIIETVISFNTDFFSQTGMDMYMGWCDGASQVPATLNDGYYFKVISNGDNTGRVWCVTGKGGVTDEYDTGINLGEDKWHSFSFQMAPGFSHCHFFVDDLDVLKKENTGGTLFTETKITPFFGSRYVGPALAENREFYVDLFSMKYRMNADRI